MNNEYIKEINGEVYRFKFKSKRCIDLEKATGREMLELLQDSSMSNIVRLLKAACLNDNVDEYDLLDKLMENSSLEKIMIDIIYEVAAISGIITREDKERIDNVIDEDKSKILDESKKK